MGPDFRLSVLAQNVKLTASLVVVSEFLRVERGPGPSREVCSSSGIYFSNVSKNTWRIVRQTLIKRTLSLSRLDRRSKTTPGGPPESSNGLLGPVFRTYFEKTLQIAPSDTGAQ